MKTSVQRSLESLTVGESAQLEKHILQEDIDAFARVSEDTNPLHVQSGVVHGMYLGALVSQLIGMQLPGERALLVKESLSFKKSVRAGDAVLIVATLMHKSEATRLIDLAISIRVGDEIVAEGGCQVHVRL